MSQKEQNILYQTSYGKLEQSLLSLIHQCYRSYYTIETINKNIESLRGGDHEHFFGSYRATSIKSLTIDLVKLYQPIDKANPNPVSIYNFFKKIPETELFCNQNRRFLMQIGENPKPNAKIIQSDFYMRNKNYINSKFKPHLTILRTQRNKVFAHLDLDHKEEHLKGLLPNEYLDMINYSKDLYEFMVKTYCFGDIVNFNSNIESTAIGHIEKTQHTIDCLLNKT